MNIQVLEDRSIIKVFCEKDGTQNENYATVLNFEFPEYVEKDGEQIATENLNKYIVFDIQGEENEDLILDNKYVLKSNITQYKTIKACIYLKEHSLNDDMTDKLVWITKVFVLDFNKSIEEKNEITQEKIDAFNTLYTELNLRIAEVNDLKDYIEQFKLDVEAGLYNGKSLQYNWRGTELGIKREDESEYQYSDLKGSITEEQINDIETTVLNNIKNSNEFDILILE